MQKGAALALLLAVGSQQASYAQQGIAESRQNQNKSFAASEWYLGFSFGDQWLLNAKDITGTFKINGGTWFNRYWGIRMKLQGGNIYRSKGAGTNTWQGSVSATYNAIPLLMGDHNIPFTFDVSAGLGFNALRYREKKEDNIYKFAPSFNIAAQASYDFSSHWGAFVELTGYVLPKYFNYDYKLPVVIAADWNIGLRYKFSAHRYKEGEAAQNERRIRELNARVEELNSRVNALLEQAERSVVVQEGTQVMLAPQKEIASVDIYFDNFSAYLSEEQKKKMEVIADWMKNNKDFSICVAVFADKAQHSEISARIRRERMEAIRSVIIEKYGIQADRIQLIEAEKLGYKNLSGCNAKIIFNK